MSRWQIGTPFDSLHKSFFDRSEAHRRWRLADDIRWPDQAPSVPEDFIVLAETFWAVESFLPDYTATVARAFRGDRARCWVHAMWSYEESKHSRAFEEWLVRGGHRTADDLNVMTDRMWGAGEWALPHDSDRRMLVYQMLQEAMTRFVYSSFRKHAEAAGDLALVDVLRHLGSDEQAHYTFFRDCVRLWLEEDRQGTTDDLYHVLVSFRMPAGHLIPDYADRSALIDRMGLASPLLFLTKVWPVVAHSVGVDPLPPALRPLAQSGMSIDEIATMLVGASTAR